MATDAGDGSFEAFRLPAAPPYVLVRQRAASPDCTFA